MRRWHLVLLLVAIACLVSLGVGLRRMRPRPASGDRQGQALHLVVLNGTGRSGLARRVARLLATAGIVVDRTGNAPHFHFRHSLLVANTLDTDAACALARRLGRVTVVPEADVGRSEDAVLVLGADVDRLLAALQEDVDRGE